MARKGRPKTELTLSESECEQLVGWSGVGVAVQDRARVRVRGRADNKSVAAQLNCAGAAVGKWLKYQERANHRD